MQFGAVRAELSSLVDGPVTTNLRKMVLSDLDAGQRISLHTSQHSRRDNLAIYPFVGLLPARCYSQRRPAFSSIGL